LRDAQDAIIGYLLIGTDNTARQQAEEALLEGGRAAARDLQQRQLLQHRHRRQGRHPDLQRRRRAHAGLHRAEVMNKITPADISIRRKSSRAPRRSASSSDPITPGFEALVFKASRGIEDIYELTYFRKDGSRFPAVVSVTALRDAQDAIIGYLLIGTDNTARKAGGRRAEEAGPAPARPAVLHALAGSNPTSTRWRPPIPPESSRTSTSQMEALTGLHARRADRRAVQELLHRSGAGRGRRSSGC
jgi:hypothetical protein